MCLGCQQKKQPTLLAMQKNACWSLERQSQDAGFVTEADRSQTHVAQTGMHLRILG